MQNLFIAIGIWFAVALVVSIGLGFFIQAGFRFYKKPDALRRMRNAGF